MGHTTRSQSPWPVGGRGGRQILPPRPGAKESLLRTAVAGQRGVGLSSQGEDMEPGLVTGTEIRRKQVIAFPTQEEPLCRYRGPRRGASGRGGRMGTKETGK